MQVTATYTEKKHKLKIAEKIRKIVLSNACHKRFSELKSQRENCKTVKLLRCKVYGVHKASKLQLNISVSSAKVSSLIDKIEK